MEVFRVLVDMIYDPAKPVFVDTMILGEPLTSPIGTENNDAKNGVLLLPLDPVLIWDLILVGSHVYT